MSVLTPRAASRRLIPESEVTRGSPEVMAFAAQAAETVKSGSRRRGRRTTGETPTPPDAGATSQTFQARVAETVTVRPPHWENLPEVPTEAESEAPPDGPSEPQPETPAPQPNKAGNEPGPAYEGPEAEPEKEP